MTIGWLVAGWSASAGPLPDVAEVARSFCRTYTDRDGLPQNTVQVLLTDRRGYLWVGTQGGAARYNGRAWTTVPRPTAVRSNFVNGMAFAADGSLWMLSDGGVHNLTASGEWRSFGPESGLPSGQVTALAETTDPEGGLVPTIAMRDGSLFRRVGDHWRRGPGAPAGDWITCLREISGPDGNPVLWAGTRQNRLLRFGRDVAEVARLTDLEAGGITSLTPGVGDDVGSIWVTGAGDLPFHIVGGTVHPLSVDVPNVGKRAIQILQTLGPNGKTTLWVGTDSGLAQRREGRWRLLDTTAGLPHNFIYSLLETKEGVSAGRTLWIGTLGGLTRLDEGKWLALDGRAGLDVPFVLSFLETTETNGGTAFWIGTYGGARGGVYRFADGRWTNYTVESGLPTNVVWALSETREADGTPSVWAVTSGGVAAFRRGRWEVVRTTVGDLSSVGTVCLLETRTPDGSPVRWIGTGQGLYRYAGGMWSRLTVADGLIDNNVRCLTTTTDAAGAETVWVGTAKGMSALVDGVWKSYPLDNNRILCFARTTDAAGRRFLWVGTQLGAFRLDLATGTWTAFNESTPVALPNNVVYQIQEDRRHRVYLATNRGITRLTPTGSKDADYSVYTFSIEDGLPSNECNRGASLVDHRGRLWFGTIAGAAVFDPALEVVDLTPKPLQVESTSVNGRPTVLAGMPLRYTENTIRLGYALLSYFRETDTRYRTQLVGLETHPSEWSADNYREYVNLGTGDYRLRIWGRDYAGNVSGPVELAFSIRPAPWRTWWAYAVYALVGIGASYGFTRYRLRLLEKRTRMLEAKVAERTERIRAQRDELEEANLKLKELDRIKADFTAMLVHDLKSPLSVVNVTLELFELNGTVRENQELAKLVQASQDSLGRILTLIDEVLEVFRTDVREMPLARTEHDPARLLRTYTDEARPAATRRDIAIDVILEPNLPTVSVDAVKFGRVLSNLLSNAVKFTPAGGLIRVEGRRIAGTGVEAGLTLLLITITDTGEGIAAEELPYLFDPYRQAEAGRKRRGVGLGLAIVKRIIAAHGGTVAVRSQLGVGTCFTIVLPTGTPPAKAIAE